MPSCATVQLLEAESLIVIRRGVHGGARVQTPKRAVAARYAGLILQHQGTTVRDVYDARVVIETPSAGFLARRRTKADLACSTEPGQRSLRVDHSTRRLSRAG